MVSTSPRIIFLDAATLGGDVDLSPISQLGDFKSFDFSTREEVLERCQKAEILITNKCVIDAEVFERAANLKLICEAATGVDNIDLAEAKSREIPVLNCKGYSTPSVVQHTFALLFELVHSTSYYSSYVKRGEWGSSPFFSHLARPYWELEGKKWGVIGFGTIGQQVASVAQAFGAEVTYYSTSGTTEVEGFTRVSLQELLSECEVVSIHAPLNDATRGLLGESELRSMKPGAVLLNLGRGGIIDEKQLVHCLKDEQQQLLVGLDVVEGEPMPDTSPLAALSDLPNVVITPHIAWASVEARNRLVAQLAAHIQQAL